VNGANDNGGNDGEDAFIRWWHEWVKPPVILAVVGYISLIIGAWLSFDGRIAQNHSDIVRNSDRIERNTGDIQNIGMRFDRHIEKGDR